MFREIIQETALTTSVANDYFGTRIYGNSMREDNTFVSTLRALLLNRIPENGCLKFEFQRSSKSAGYYSRAETEGQMKEIVGFYDSDDIPEDRIYYHRCESADQSANTAALEYIEKKFLAVFDGFERIQRVTDFFIKRAKVLCYVNPEIRTVFIFTGPINMRIYHYLQCGIYAMLPWYFATEDRPTEDEMNVIRSLRENDPSDYKMAIRKIADGLNFRDMIIRKALAGFESTAYRSELNNIAGQINSKQNMINDLYRKVREAYQEKSNLEIRSLGLMAKIADSAQNSEYMEYFLSNRNLSLVSCNGIEVKIVARGYLMFFDEDNAKCVIDNDTGIMYCPDGDSLEYIIPTRDMKALMRAVFIDRRIKIRVCAYYCLTRSGVMTSSGYHYGDEFMDCTPNPHIDRYSCIGNYEEAINTLIYEGNYIGATEQCLASCQSLNFGDIYVMEEFARRLYGISPANMNCFELPDGSVTNPKGAIEWLKNEETRQEEAQEE